MTYGELLRHFRLSLGIENKSEFARRLGMKDPDHYIGAENDKESRKPSLDLLEAAAKLAGKKLEDYLQIPVESKKPVTREDGRLHRQLQDLLDLGGEAGDLVRSTISAYHRLYSRRR